MKSVTQSVYSLDLLFYQVGFKKIRVDYWFTSSHQIHFMDYHLYPLKGSSFIPASQLYLQCPALDADANTIWTPAIHELLTAILTNYQVSHSAPKSDVLINTAF